MGFLDLLFLSVDSTVIDLAAALDRSGKLVFKKRSCPAVPQDLQQVLCLLKFRLRELRLSYAESKFL